MPWCYGYRFKLKCSRIGLSVLIFVPKAVLPTLYRIKAVNAVKMFLKILLDAFVEESELEELASNWAAQLLRQRSISLSRKLADATRAIWFLESSRIKY